MSDFFRRNRDAAGEGGTDADGDGLSDEFEPAVLGTDPVDRDIDDGLDDHRESDFGINGVTDDVGEGADEGFDDGWASDASI